VKKAVFVVLQTLLLLAAYACGVVLQIAGKIPMWTMVSNGGRSIFIWDGLDFFLAAFVLVLLVQALRKTLRTNWWLPVLAFVLGGLFLAATHFPMARITTSGM
jgi:hypothetical protein